MSSSSLFSLLQWNDTKCEILKKFHTLLVLKMNIWLENSYDSSELRKLIRSFLRLHEVWPEFVESNEKEEPLNLLKNLECVLSVCTPTPILMEKEIFKRGFQSLGYASKNLTLAGLFDYKRLFKIAKNKTIQLDQLGVEDQKWLSCLVWVKRIGWENESHFDQKFIYPLTGMVTIPDFDPKTQNICSKGIHLTMLINIDSFGYFGPNIVFCSIPIMDLEGSNYVTVGNDLTGFGDMWKIQTKTILIFHVQPFVEVLDSLRK